MRRQHKFKPWGYKKHPLRKQRHTLQDLRESSYLQSRWDGSTIRTFWGCIYKRFDRVALKVSVPPNNCPTLE